MKKTDFTGTRQVFAFTIGQYLKSKSILAMLILMVIMSGVSMFAMTSSISTGSDIADTDYELGFDEIAVVNESTLPVRLDDISSYSPDLEDIGITEAQFSFADGGADLEIPKTVYIIITESDGKPQINIDNSRGLADSYALDLVTSAAINAVNLAAYRAAGVTDEQLAALNAPIYTNIGFTEVPSSPDDSLVEDEGYFGLSYIYSIIVLMLVMFSTSFIVQSIVEEKASKLVELLMVSVKPLALILGKILATMGFMLVAMLALVVGVVGSSTILSVFYETTLTDIISSSGLEISAAGMGVGALLAAMFSILLGYLTFSIIGGIAGACCSTLEDSGSATGTVAMLTLLGYMVALFLPMFGSSAAVKVCALLPIISVFIAPVAYASGVIGIGMLLISWLIQCAIIALLAAFASRVYSTLIIHKGNRIKLKQLLKIAKGGA